MTSKHQTLESFKNDLTLSMAAKTPFYVKVPDFLVSPLMSRFCPNLRNYHKIVGVLFDAELAAGSCSLFVTEDYPDVVVEQKQLLDFVEGYKKVLDDELPKAAPADNKKWTFETFADEAKRTRNPQLNFKDRLINNAFGLSGEVGEFVDLMKKALFHGTEVPREKIVKELGDIQYYWAETVSTLGEQLKFTIQDVLDTNSKKLRERYPDGFSFAAANERKDEKVEKVTNEDGKKADLYKLYSALMDDMFGLRG